MSAPDRRNEVIAEWYELRASGAEREAAELLDAHPELVGELPQDLSAMQILDRLLEDPVGPSLDPRTIGPYRVVREVGRGGMGVVYEAEQLAMERRVALKVLTPTLTGVGRSVQRFKAEARAAGRLHHTNIVPVYDMGQHDGHWYYAMELVEGWPLCRLLEDLRAGGARAESSRSRIREASDRASGGDAPDGGTAWFERVASMFAGVADALHAAHEAGIVHRDVKPGNLLLHTDGALKLVDFGLAHLDDNGPTMTRTGDVLGTPAYMSPEQAAARREQVDHRTDVYSLGATLYEVLTLRPPFLGESLAELCTQISSSEPVALRRVDSGIPRDLETIVQKAMEKDVERRYASAAELAGDLRAFCQGASIQARRIGPLVRVARRIRRHKTVSVLLAVALVLGLGGGWVWWRLEAVERARRYDDLIALGHEAHASGELRDGASSAGYYAQAIATDPDRPEAYWLRALASEDEDARLADVDRARERGLSKSSAHWLRAYLLRKADRYAAATRELARTQSSPGQATSEEWYLRGTCVSGIDDRIELFTKAISASSPQHLVRQFSLRARAEAYEDNGEFERALDDRLALRAMGVRSPVEQVRIAVLWHFMGRESAEQEALVEAFRMAGATRDPSRWLRVLQTSLDCDLTFAWTERRWSTASASACLEATALLPKSSDRLRVVGYSHRVLHHHEDALRAYRELIVDDADDFEIRQEFCAALIEAGRFREAERVARRALADRPGASVFWRRLGKSLLLNGDADSAVDAYRQAVRVERSSVSLCALGTALGSLAKFDEAVLKLEQALSLRASDRRAVGYLANGLRSLGRAEQASIVLRRALNLWPRDRTILFQLTYDLIDGGRAAESFALLRRALAAGHDDPYLAALWSRAVSHALPNDASSNARMAFEIGSEESGGFLELTRDLIGAGRTSEAVHCARAAFERGGGPVERTLLAEAISLQDPEAGIELAYEVISHYPDEVRARQLLASILVSMNRFREAIPQFDWVIERETGNIVARLGLAHCKLGLEDFDAAFTALNEAVDLGWTRLHHFESAFHPEGRAMLKRMPGYRQLMGRVLRGR